MADIKSIGVLAYHHCSESDTIIPWEILTGVKVYLETEKKKGPLDVKLVALKPGMVEMQMGSHVEPHAVLGDELYDLFYVPGGRGSGPATKDPVILNAIKRHYDNGKFLAANCVGVGILQRAGVLGKTPITCSPPVYRRLKEEGANVADPRPMWLGAPEARIWTTAGASAINAGTVAMVNYLFGDEIGHEMSMWFDTRGETGYQLFERRGREYYGYPAAEAKIQDETADILLPPLPAMAHHR